MFGHISSTKKIISQDEYIIRMYGFEGIRNALVILIPIIYLITIGLCSLFGLNVLVIDNNSIVILVIVTAAYVKLLLNTCNELGVTFYSYFLCYSILNQLKLKESVKADKIKDEVKKNEKR